MYVHAYIRNYSTPFFKLTKNATRVLLCVVAHRICHVTHK